MCPGTVSMKSVATLPMTRNLRNFLAASCSAGLTPTFSLNTPYMSQFTSPTSPPIGPTGCLMPRVTSTSCGAFSNTRMRVRPAYGWVATWPVT